MAEGFLDYYASLGLSPRTRISLVDGAGRIIGSNSFVIFNEVPQMGIFFFANRRFQGKRILSDFFEEQIIYYAINQGILVKQGDVVSVACLQAIRGTTLETLGDTVDASFRSQDEDE